MSVNSNILWTFGDSFVAQDHNYITLYKKKTGCKYVNIQAKPGSSLQYLLERLLNVKSQFNENDHILIGLPGPLRGYYRNKHYCNLELFKAFDFLITEHDLERDHRAIASHIINDIVPNLTCKNIKIFTTVENIFYGEYEYLPMMYCIMDEIVEYIAQVENLNPKSRRIEGTYSSNEDRIEIEKKIQRFPNHIPFKYEEYLTVSIAEHIYSSPGIIVPLRK